MKIPGVREDHRTGQFVPMLNGYDISPTSFDEERAWQIARVAAESATVTLDEPRVSQCCPLCCRAVDSNNRLTARYYTPMDWWVISHETRDDEANEWHECCAQARYQLVFNP